MKNKKILVPIVIALLLLVAVVVLEKTNTTNFIKMPGRKATTQQGPTPEQVKEAADADNNAKKQFIENGGDQTTTPSKPVDSSNIDLTASQAADGSVTVITKVTGYSTGKCKLTATNGDKTTTQEANLMYQREFSTCAGFSVPVDPLGKGSWSIKLDVTSGETTISKETSLEVM